MGKATIFIPGIQGTKLVETNRVNFDTVWSGIQKNFESIEDLELTLELNGQRFDHELDNIIHPGSIEELAYREFLGDLNTKEPIYIFNYDWRFSNKRSGENLNDFVNYLTEKAKAIGKPIDSFNFVTHSMGNVCLRYYIKHYGFSAINKIVFCVPPFDGSLDIISAALTGEGLFSSVKTKIRKITRTFPGALELLPIYDKAVSFSDNSEELDIFNHKHWQKNITSNGNSSAPKFIKTLEEAKETIEEDSLADLSQLSTDQRDRILIIMRTGYKTMQSLYVHKQQDNQPDNYFDLENACVTENGDGRVADISSCCFHDSIKTICIKDAFFHRDYSHGFFLKDERVQRLTNRFLYKDNFNTSSPGNSIYFVKGVKEETNKKGQPYWSLILE
tara:strand:+ start:7672 stop:8838 length:1167 start_codon:yes stop_codon:yes gene_type:complete